MRSVVLPNDLKIIAPNELEARALYREIFIEKTYAPDGVNVTDGDCVFDVGANIGPYSIFLSQNHRDLKIYAFEPIPQTFSILRKNIEALIHNSRLEMFNFGLSNKSGISLFEFDRFSTFTATMCPEEVYSCVRKDAGMRVWAATGISDLQKVGVISTGFAAFLLSGLSKPVIGWIVASAMMTLIVLSLIRKRIFLQKIECELKTISDVIRERQLAAIALVKIDVEGSEWDVIEGISEEDWPKIKQFVVEAHDVDGRVEKMKSVFESRGYRTVVSQEDWELHKLINAFTIIAVRN